MDDQTKERVLALSHTTVASLTLADIGFLMRQWQDHADEMVLLVPDLAGLFEL